MQLLLFPEIDKDDSIKFDELLVKYDNLRKSTHSRISYLQKEIKELRAEMDFLTMNLCKGKIYV